VLLNAACLFVSGALRATIPASEFSVAWIHSVARTRWEERYRVEDGALRLVVARVQGSGAGMEPGADAVLRDGWWTWTPRIAPLREVRLTLSSYTQGYDLCWRDRCQTLRSLVGPPAGPALADGTSVELRACRSKPP
jgi:hypothetical protein